MTLVEARGSAVKPDSGASMKTSASMKKFDVLAEKPQKTVEIMGLPIPARIEKEVMKQLGTLDSMRQPDMIDFYLSPLLKKKPDVSLKFMKEMTEFLLLFGESDRAKCGGYVAEIVDADREFGAASLSRIKKIIALIPQQDRDYALGVGVLRICQSRAWLTPSMLSKISDILESLPEHSRKGALCTGLARAFEAQPWINDKILGWITDAAKSLPKEERPYFLKLHVTEIFEGLPPSKLEGAEAAMQKSVRNISAGRRVLPGETLLGRHLEYEESCPQSKDYFKRALQDGALVEAWLPMPKFEMHVIIKGLVAGKDHGHVLAYEPDTNTVWSIKMSDGNLLGARKLYKFNNNDLQKMVLEKLWAD